MEIRDLYDENKEITGETIEIGQSIPKGRYYLTVVVFIQNSKGEFLLQVNKKYNMWAITGGHPTTGQTSLDGIVTETKEELGIVVDKDKLKLFKTIKTEDDYVDLYYLKIDIDLKELIIQEDEVEEVKWANIEEIKMMTKSNMFLPPHIDFLNDCLVYLKEVEIV